VPGDVWRDVLDASPEALAFQAPAWLDCICEVDGYEDASRLYETSGGGQLVMPMVRRTRLLGALAKDESLPWGWGFGGLVAREATRMEDVAAVLSDMTGRAGLRTTTRVRPTPLTAATWAAAAPPGAARIPRLAHVLDLEGGFDQLWTARFTGSARRAVRKAEREGFSVECDTSGRLVPAFYELYRRSLERWARREPTGPAAAQSRGPRQDTLRKFQLVAERLGDVCRMWLARIDGRPAAAIIVLLQGSNASYWRGVMDEELAGHANYMLQRLAIEDACRAGCRYYHMGETGWSDSLAQYKRSFGAQPFHYSEYRLERLPIARLSDRLHRVKERVTGMLGVGR
jgi:hypothetical protein